MCEVCHTQSMVKYFSLRNQKHHCLSTGSTRLKEMFSIQSNNTKHSTEFIVGLRAWAYISLVPPFCDAVFP
jgi:hypothetical protein